MPPGLTRICFQTILQLLPQSAHFGLTGADITNGNTDGKLAAQFRVREEEVAVLVNARHQTFVEFVQGLFIVLTLWVGTQTDQAERYGGHDLEVRRFLDPLHELLRYPDMFTQARRQPLLTEIA